MDAGLLDVLHDAADEHVLAVGQRIDVDLDRVRQVAVEEQRVLAEERVDLPGLVVRVARLDLARHQLRQRAEQVVAELRLLADDLHRPAAEHVGGPHHQREAEVADHQPRLLDRIGDAVLRLLQAELSDQLLEAVAVLGEVDHVRRGAEDRHLRVLQRRGELQRRLAAELDDDAVERALRLLDADDLEHVLGGQRLEIEPVRGVVVGRDGLGIAVDHDRLVAGVGQREAGMAAAIVELDALADAVRAAAEDHHLLRLGRLRLVGRRAGEGHLVGRVEIGGRRGELGRAGVDPLVDRVDVEPGAERRHLGLAGVGELGEARVGEALRLEPAERPGAVGQAVLPELRLGCDDPLELAEEPRVDMRGAGDLLDAHAEADRLGAGEQPVRRRPAERGADGVLVVALAEAGDLDLVEAGQPVSRPRSAFCSDSAKVRPIAITSPTDFIEVVSSGSAPGNFSNAKRGILVTT